MTYGPDASHFTERLPRRAEPALITEDSPVDVFDLSGGEELALERKSRLTDWWPILRAHWPR